MKRVLVDSSVWGEYFAGNKKTKVLSELIDLNLICINNLILAELIPFLKHKHENEVITLLQSIENMPLIINWDEIISFQLKNIKNGLNRIGIPDLIILQNVINNNLELFTLDKHFILMSKKMPFKLFEY